MSSARWTGRLERIPRASGLGQDDEKSAGWEVGDLPTSRMAYIIFPQHNFKEVHGRTEDHVQSLPPGAEDKQAALARKAERDRSGWASPGREIYKPLGPPVELPSLGLGDAVVPRFHAAFQ